MAVSTVRPGSASRCWAPARAEDEGREGWAPRLRLPASAGLGPPSSPFPIPRAQRRRLSPQGRGERRGGVRGAVLSSWAVGTGALAAAAGAGCGGAGARCSPRGSAAPQHPAAARSGVGPVQVGHCSRQGAAGVGPLQAQAPSRGPACLPVPGLLRALRLRVHSRSPPVDAGCPL